PRFLARNEHHPSPWGNDDCRIINDGHRDSENDCFAADAWCKSQMTWRSPRTRNGPEERSRGTVQRTCGTVQRNGPEDLRNGPEERSRGPAERSRGTVERSRRHHSPNFAAPERGKFLSCYTT